MSMLSLPYRTIGKDQPCFIIAELGINHNGDMSLARDMIQAAKSAGADAVKVQNYITEDFVKDKHLTFTYTSQGRQVTETQYELFKRCELSKEQLHELNQYCRDNHIIFMSTPTSSRTLKDLIDCKVQILKNGSDFLRNTDFISEMAKTGLPLILSTGMASLKEIASAVEVFYQSGGDQIAILHCTSTYPSKAQDIHLQKINTLAQVFNVPVGLSDHSEGHFAAVGSIPFGASIIEKHFTLDHQLPGPDHWFSAQPDEMKMLVDGVRFVEQAIGQPKIGYTQSEQEGREAYTLSCVANDNLDKGHRLTPTDIVFSRPGFGIPPEHKPYLTGRVLAKPLKKGDLLLLEALC